MNNVLKCNHSICNYIEGYAYMGVLSEEEIYEEVRSYFIACYDNYKYGSFDEHSVFYVDKHFDFSKKNYVKEYEKANYGNRFYYFNYCPDCGAKLHCSSIVRRINNKLYEEIRKLPIRTDKELKEIRSKIRRLQIERKKDREQEIIEYGYGCVYVAKLGNHYKIGISKTPKTRLKEFTKLPYELETILCEKVNDYENAEIELHEHFANKRVRGEWFELKEEDIDYIKNHLKSKK